MTNIEQLSKWALEIKSKLKSSVLCRQEISEDAIKEKQCLLKVLTKYLKKVKIKLTKLNEKLLQCQNWRLIHHEGLLIQSHLYRWKHGLRMLKVDDWEQQNKEREIVLIPPLSGQEEVAARIRKSKKLRLGIPHIEREINKAATLIETLSKLVYGIELLTEMSELVILRQILFPPVVKKISNQQKKTPAEPYREYWTASGHPIWVGKKAKDNEILSFNLAHGSDWWLHVQGFSGSHVVLRGFKQNEPDYDSLQDALQLALFHSQAKKVGVADVIVTQQKYLSRCGKSKHNIGKVQVSKFRTQYVVLDNQRIEKIKKRL